jgi:hypothetical protein
LRNWVRVTVHDLNKAHLIQIPCLKIECISRLNTQKLTRMHLSVLAEYKSFEPCRKTKEVMGPRWPWKFLTWLRFSIDQIRTVLSSPPLAMYLSSPEIATHLTWPVWLCPPCECFKIPTFLFASRSSKCGVKCGRLFKLLTFHNWSVLWTTDNITATIWNSNANGGKFVRFIDFDKIFIDHNFVGKFSMFSYGLFLL